jgi:hypothetical protein
MEDLVKVRWIYKREEYNPSLKIAFKPGREYHIPGWMALLLKKAGRVEYAVEIPKAEEEEIPIETETGETAANEDGASDVKPRPTGGKPGIFSSRRSRKE